MANPICVCQEIGKSSYIIETTARETKLRFFNFCSRGKVIDRKIIRTRIDGYRFEEEGAS